MPAHEGYWTCDLGGERHDTRDAVRNESLNQNGEDGRMYLYICDKHFKKLMDVIDEAFPQNIKRPSAQG